MRCRWKVRARVHQPVRGRRCLLMVCLEVPIPHSVVILVSHLSPMSTPFLCFLHSLQAKVPQDSLFLQVSVQVTCPESYSLSWSDSWSLLLFSLSHWPSLSVVTIWQSRSWLPKGTFSTTHFFGEKSKVYDLFLHTQFIRCYQFKLTRSTGLGNPA